MTMVAVLADPPRPGLVLPELAASTPLSEDECADLYAAMLKDVLRAVENSGGDLLVNYRADEDLPEEHQSIQAVESELRDLAEDCLDAPEDARFEVQVGQTFSGRVGNTLTHLLDREEVKTAAAVEPTAMFLTRKEIDNAAMKLRRHPVILGPSTDGRVYYAGFDDPINFEGAYTSPAVETLTDRGLDAGFEVDFLPNLPVVETVSDLVTAITLINARQAAGRIYPRHSAAVIEALGLRVEKSADGLALMRD
ncbi:MULTISPECIES: hypothetical protein [unclassified Haladaptatus]|uniref:hypothetical protein n=1 Tax=unclassified Haladaptatus TaxID=2622732 RepID=UPI0023E84591|nr:MULTISPECIES: hypothetical protein [unclassified Haladaptatus]